MASKGTERILGVRSNRRTVLKGATGAAAGMYAFGVVGKSYQRALAQDSRPRANPRDPRGRRRPADRCEHAGSRRIDPGTDQGERPARGVQRRRALLHGPQQPESSQHRLPRRSSPPGRSTPAPRSPGSTWRRPTTTRACSRRSPPARSTSTSWRWARPSKATSCGQGLASEMPDWVKQQIDMTDYVGYLQAPVGTWDGKTYRVSIDGDCHNFNYRTDYLRRCRSGGGVDCRRAAQGEWGVPTTWQQVQAVLQVPEGQAGRRPGRSTATSTSAQALGRLRLLLPRQPGQRLRQAPGRQGVALRRRHHEAAHQQPGLGARDPGRASTSSDAQPPDQINADRNTTGFRSSWPAPARCCSWWGDIGSNAKTNDSSVIGDVVGFDILPGSDDVYNATTGAWDTLSSGPNYAPNMAYIGWGVYVMTRVDADPVKQKAAWSAAAHLGGKDISLWTVGLPLRLPAVPQQPLQHPGVGRRGLRRGVHHQLPELRVQLLQPPECRDRAAHPGHLPVLQHRRGRAGEDLRRRDRRPDRRRQHRRRLGEDHRRDRPRAADRALPGIARLTRRATSVRAAFLGAGRLLATPA